MSYALTDKALNNTFSKYFQEQYESFHYTSLVYLNTYKKDFEGGRFIFIDGMEGNETKFSVEPKAGRVNAFTSGHENVHHIERVVHGTRYSGNSNIPLIFYEWRFFIVGMRSQFHSHAILH